MNIKSEAKYVLETLNKVGKGYLVGGAVRDYLLNIEPLDFDFATDIEQNQIIKIFKQYSPKILNKNYEITQFFINDVKIEIARMRKDIGSRDSRYPKSVQFITNIHEDLKRRDFTINAMAYSNGEIIDPYGGQKDIKHRIIRTVGRADIRFREDVLRILRAFKYASKLNFKFDKNIQEYLLNNKNNINIFMLSKERICQELTQILNSKYINVGINLMIETKILKHLLGVFQDKDNNKRNITDMYYSLKSASEKNINSDIGAILTIFTIYLLKINQNYLKEKYKKEKYNTYIFDTLMKLGFNSSVIYSVIDNIRLYKFLESKPNFKTNSNRKAIFKIFGSKIDIGLVYIIYSIINERYDKKYTQKLLYILQKLKFEFVDSDQIQIQGSDIFNSQLNKFDSVYNIKNMVQFLVWTNRIKNSKEEILKYLYRKYKIKSPICYEYCAGAVVYDKSVPPDILIVKINSGNWGFAKGHIEKGESSTQTAIREVKEETNLDIDILHSDKFKRKIEYVIHNQCIKKIDYYIGRAKHKDVVLDPVEIEDYRWLKFKQAYNRISYRAQKDVLLDSYLEMYGRNNEK